jgi:hypothetical protein
MCPAIMSAIIGGLSTIGSTVASGASAVASAVGSGASAVGGAFTGGLNALGGAIAPSTLSATGAATGATTGVGLMAAGTGLSAVGSLVQTGIGVKQAKAQVAAAEAAAESAHESAAMQARTEGERLGQQHDITSRENDRRIRAARAAEATTRIVLAGRGIKGGNTRRALIRNLRRDQLEHADAAKRGLLAAGRANTAAVAGINAQRDARIQSLNPGNPVAAGVAGAFDFSNTLTRGYGRILPVIN